MTNRQLLRRLKELEANNPELLDDETIAVFMNSDYESDISDAGIRTEIVNENFEFEKLDKPQFRILINC